MGTSDGDGISYHAIRNEEDFRLWVRQNDPETLAMAIEKTRLLVYKAGRTAALFSLDLASFDIDGMLDICSDEHIYYER